MAGCGGGAAAAGSCGLLRAALAVSCHRQLSKVKFMLLFFSCHHFHINSDAVQQAAVRFGGTAELCDEGHEQWQVTTLCLPDNARLAAWGRDAARRRRHHFEQLPLSSIQSGKTAVELRGLLACPWSDSSHHSVSLPRCGPRPRAASARKIQRRRLAPKRGDAGVV